METTTTTTITSKNANNNINSDNLNKDVIAGNQLESTLTKSENFEGMKSH
jgi:hypothetical protein